MHFCEDKHSKKESWNFNSTKTAVSRHLRDFSGAKLLGKFNSMGDFFFFLGKLIAKLNTAMY